MKTNVYPAPSAKRNACKFSMIRISRPLSEYPLFPPAPKIPTHKDPLPNQQIFLYIYPLCDNRLTLLRAKCKALIKRRIKLTLQPS